MTSNPLALAEVRLVVFDAGGVIVRVMPTWEAAQARAGIVTLASPTEPAFVALQAEADRRTKLGKIDTATHAALVADALGISPGQVERILEAQLVDEYAGWNDVIDRLDAAGVETALLSNTSAFQWQYLAPDGALAGAYPAIARLRRLFASHHLGLMKPDPAIYAAVEDATGSRGREVLFFDDRTENVDAARAIGWRAALIDPLGQPAEQVLAVLDGAGP